MIYPLLRLKQVVSYPPFFFTLIKRSLWDKKYSFRYVDKFKNIKQLNAEETLLFIIKHNKSIMRFGDGEFGLLHGAGIFSHITSWNNFSWCQKFSEGIKVGIKNLLGLKHKDILIAFPDVAHIIHNEKNGSAYSNKERIYQNMHVEARKSLWKFIHKKQTYGSAFVFLPAHHSDFNWSLIQEYVSSKTIIIITGDIFKLKDINLGKEVFFIEAGVHNAFERKHILFEEICSFIKQHTIPKNNALFLVSVGPTACFVVEFLSNLGYVAWDTGHFFQLAEKEIKKITSMV